MLKVPLGGLLKRCEDRDCEQEEERSGLGERSYQKHQTMSGASGLG